MNIAEILRGLADKIDGAEQQVPHQDQRAELHQVEPVSDEGEEINTDSMVGPLQQKLELIKKLAGVEGAYSDGALSTDVEDSGCAECGCDPCECDTAEQDPLAVMKKMAGLADPTRAATVVVADEDEPFEG